MKKNKFYLLFCLAMGSLLLSSCLKDDDDYVAPPAGVLTMVNGYIDAQAVMYYTQVGTIPPIKFREYASTQLFAGDRRVAVTGSASPATLADTTFSVKADSVYTSFLYGNKDKVKHAIVLNKKMSTSAAAEKPAGVRFLNLADVGGKVSLQFGDAEIVAPFKDRPVETQVTATANQTFIAQPNGTFTLKIKDEAGTVLATREGLKFESEKHYTIILIGKKDDATTPLYIGQVVEFAN